MISTSGHCGESMGINVELQTERGETLQVCADTHSLLPRILQRADISGTSCLRFIDAFGDTTFNRGQATVLLQELAGVRPNLEDRERALVDCIIRIAEQAERQAHLYLKFIGD
jgi:hypothetical protein